MTTRTPPHRIASPAPLAAAAGALLLVLLLPQAGAAAEVTTALLQGAPARRMRDFWHVFAAYAIAWLLLGGWVVAIVRRLGRVEARLSQLPDAGEIEGRDGSTGGGTPGDPRPR